MEQGQQTEQELVLSDHARILWRRRWYILVPIVAGVIGALAYTFMITPVYRADALMRVNAAAPRPQQIDPFSGLFLSREAVASFVQMVNTPQVINQAATNLDLASRKGSLGKVSASQIKGTEFFRVQVEGPDPVLARDAANEVALVLKLESELDWERRMTTAEQFMRWRVDELQSKISDTRQLLASAPDDDNSQLLQIQLSGYESQHSTALRSLEESQLVGARTRGVLVVQAPATTPGRPVNVKPIVNFFIGAIMGAVLGFGAAYLREQLDRTPKSPEEVRQLLGVPVMGAVPLLPNVKELRDGLIIMRDPDGPPLGESYHLLRTNLQSSHADDPSKLLLVTSSQIGEEKTTTLANLGAAMAQAGKNIILVDADLRRPQLHHMFDMQLEGGLTDLLAEESVSTTGILKESSLDKLWVLTAGSQAKNPAILLDTERLRRILEQLSEKADAVLLDSPPVLYVSDALILASYVDHVLLVLGSGNARRESVKRTREALEMVKAPRVDVVLNKIRRESYNYSYYSYYYYYNHRSK